MGGMYVAKAITVPASTDPPGWDVDWTWPGPWPPGYTPVLSLGITGQSVVDLAGDVDDLDVTLYDQDTYATHQPYEDKITYTATWKDDSTSVLLRLDGVGDYGSSVTTGYSDMGNDFWGKSPDFDFQVGAEDVGRVIVLQAASDPFGEGEITKTIEITVVAAYTWTAKITFSMTDVEIGAPSGSYGGAVQVTKSGAWGGSVWPWCWVWNGKTDNGVTVRWENDSSIINDDGDYEPSEAPFGFGVRMQDLTIPPDVGNDTDAWILSVNQDNGVMVIEVLDLFDYDWDIGYSHAAIDTEGPSVTFSYVLQLYRNGALMSAETFQYTKNDNDSASTGYPTPILLWEIDGDTKVITEH
jgi:hypothetical protein